MLVFGHFQFYKYALKKDRKATLEEQPQILAYQKKNKVEQDP